MQKENDEKNKNGGKEPDGSKNKEEKTLYTNSQPITEFLREEIKKSTKWISKPIDTLISLEIIDELSKKFIINTLVLV